MNRPQPNLNRHRMTPEDASQTQSDQPGVGKYEVATSVHRTFSGIVPTLKVVRLADMRVIYPFRGCPEMPLCADTESAKRFAEDYGWRLVNGDIAVPE